MNNILELNFSLSYLEIYLIFINIITFIVYGYDKVIAIKNTKNNLTRISEFNLLLLSIFGGTIASIISMFLFRHKIKKFSFLWKFILILMVQMVIIFYLEELLQYFSI